MRPGLLRPIQRLDNRVLLLIFYFLAFWPLLVNNGIYWDDWVLYYQTPQTLTNMFSELGSPPAGYLVRALASVPPVFGKWFVFIVYMLAMIVLYQIFVKTRLFSKNEALLLTLFATLIPYNFARVTVACSRYGLCYLLFLVAFLSVMTYMSRRRRIILRITSLALFFVSFDTNSLLFFYIIVLAYIAYSERASLTSLKGVGKECVAYLDFILLPVVFYAIKATLLVPYGIYSDYNTVGIDKVNRSPYEFLLILKSSFVDVIGGSLATAASALVVSALLMLGTYWVLARRVAEGTPGMHAYRIPGRRFLLGVLLLYIGVLPYIAIGRDGATFGTEWESRDQLLLGIGAAFMLYYGLKYLFERFGVGDTPQRLIFTVLVAAFVLTNAGTYLRFQADWFKQVAFIENIREISAAKDNTTFTVEDRATALDAVGRHVQFYEYNGMLKQAFGTKTRLAAPSTDIGAFSDPGFLALCVERPQYNFQDYVFAAPTHKIVVDPGVREVGFASGARLLVKELLAPASFRADVKQVLSVRVEPVDQVAAPAP